MSLTKDIKEDLRDYHFSRRFIGLSGVIRDHRKWRKQRADRGWSDRDTWGAGEHIAGITAEMLQQLNDYSYAGRDDWFKLNIDSSYNNLQELIDDIQNYLEYQKVDWSEGLTAKPKDEDDDSGFSLDWYSGDKKLSDAQVTKRVQKYSRQNKRLLKKAQKAMAVFGKNFSTFWD